MEPSADLCRNGRHGVPEWSTRCSATVDTVFRNGGHGGSKFATCRYF
ncbi:hypothetical protein [Kibdelosporangium philippinense]